MSRSGILLSLCVAAGGVVGVVACGDASSSAKGGDLAFDAGPVSVEGPGLSGDAGGTTWTDLYRDFFGPTGVASCAGNGTCHGATDQAGALGSLFVCNSPVAVFPDAGAGDASADDGGDAGGDAATSTDASASSDAGVITPEAIAAARTACLSSLKGPSGLISAGTPATDTGLYAVLRKFIGFDDAGARVVIGTMPKSPRYEFTAADRDRLITWINSGAKDD